MNRNVESHFAELPSVNIERSIFDRPFNHKTSFNVGDLIPFFCDLVLPGDTFDVTTSIVARLQTLQTPIMDSMYIDTYYFFVPMRLLWTHWKEFMGENTAGPWAPSVQYTPPKISSPSGGWSVGSLADYLGIPPLTEFNSSGDGLMPQALKFRAYALICQEWFRDQNVSDPLNIPLGDANQTGSNGSNYITDVVNGGMPFKVAKFHDYFTSCLPSAQKASSPVTFPLLNGTDAPVVTRNTNHGIGQTWMHLSPVGGSSATGSHALFAYNDSSGGSHSWTLQADTNHTIDPGTGTAYFAPVNLYADLTSSVGSVTVNELRLAFQLQKFYEKQARAGSRLRETILEMFGVRSPDARMMIPEYLGGHRFPLAIHQVANTSETETASLGELGAMSNTSDIHSDFVKSFTEHGFVMGVMCARYDHSYPQGMSRDWFIEDRFSLYWPVFANLGESPVYRYEIDATYRSGEDRKATFGFQEAWASYRYKPNRVSAELRPGVPNSLANWHLADNYVSTPHLSDSWIREDKSNVDRVLSVTSALANQVFADIEVKNIATRPMPLYSLPGLIDHH